MQYLPVWKLFGGLPQADTAAYFVACIQGSIRAGITSPPTPGLARLQPRHNAAQYQARQHSEQVKQQLLDSPGMADFLQSACSR